MSTGNIDDEPIVDSGARYCVGEPSLDEIESHRSKPTVPAGPFSPDFGATFPISSAGPSAHRHRRRRKRLHVQAREDASKTQPADPSEHIMFLLGECDEEGEQTHQLFCELDEFWNDPTGSGETEWREAARWIKFEEDVEENGERWSKPHVATLSLFSLFELRNCLANCVIMLNLEAYSMEQIADLVANILVSESHITLDMRENLVDVLLRRHVHLHERVRSRGASTLPLIRSLADIGKRHSSKEVDKDMPTQSGMHKLPSYAGIDSLDPALAAHVAAHAQATGGGHSEVVSGSLQGKYDLHFLKKIPPGSETSNILVGETVFLSSPVTVFIRLREAILLGDLTEVPVPTRFLFIHLGVMGHAQKYREIGRSMGVLMSDEVFHDVAYKAKTRIDLLSGLDEFLSAATVLPPGEWDPSIRIEPPPSVPSQDSRKTAPNGTQSGPAPTSAVTAPDTGIVLDQLHVGGERLAGLCLAAVGNATLLGHQTEEQKTKHEGGGKSDCRSDGPLGDGPPEPPPIDDDSGGHDNDPALQRTGRLFGGLMRDIRRRAPYYLSDFRDALHVQCCASFIFLYFACLTPIITFGGLLAQATGGYLGTMESILSGAVVGILYSLFSGQPLTIMGSTGPVLIFEGIVYKMCLRMAWDYLSFRLWIGFWVALFLMTMVALDLSALVKYITRFTEESFASLIAFIFIIEAIKKTFSISKYYPVDLGWTPEVIPHHNCSCAPPHGATDAQVLELMYTNHPLMEVPVVRPDGQKELISGSEMELANFTLNAIDWKSVSDGRFSWDSLRIRELCHDLNGTWFGADCKPFYVPDVFFFSCILAIFTFIIAVGLKSMRTSLFFPSRVRALISDFSVVIAISLTTLTDALLQLHTPKLQVPSSVSPTLGYRRRGWIVPAFGQNPWWTSLAAIGPALLATILIFMDQQITAVIVNRRENKLKKGAGYHLDLLLVSITIMINSILGIPWFVAATVLSINHVLSLKKESEASAPGERPVYLGCREQRVTGFLIFLFIGLSVFMTPLLSHIPMAVLYGIFLFMGISSLNGVQMVQRVGLMLMPIKYQPDYSYLRHVRLRRVHMYTVIQVSCFVMLWVIKSVEMVSILFPIMVLAMCFIRKGLDFLFTQDELKWLDQLLPGSKHREPPRNVFRVTSACEMQKDGKPLISSGVHLDQFPRRNEPKRINITEEVSKTSIWRQLSGADIKEASKVQSTKPKSKDSEKRSRKRKDRPIEEDEGQPDDAAMKTSDNKATTKSTQQGPVTFCIDPKEDILGVSRNWDYADEDASDSVQARTGILPRPEITVCPPSGQGSPDSAKRMPPV